MDKEKLNIIVDVKISKWDVAIGVTWGILMYELITIIANATTEGLLNGVSNLLK